MRIMMLGFHPSSLEKWGFLIGIAWLTPTPTNRHERTRAGHLLKLKKMYDPNDVLNKSHVQVERAAIK